LRAAVRRDEHKCHAFVRFNAVPDAEAPMGVRYVAWYRPDHPILTLVAPFFARRFAAMRWSLWTPEASAHWDGREVRYGAGCDASAAPSPDAMGELWKTYYASVFNPARLKLRAMHQELPRRFLKHLPEAPLVRELVQEAPRRLQTFLKAQWRS
ncbi:MAG TPA: TIGR03915 family putative DNA repair protein, partial [Myxococcota bacterium]|nr:TIGR03915 family putative DNA repair protein [Myxococcota bacterium]